MLRTIYIATLLIFASHSGDAQASCMAYQGSLTDGGDPANGRYEIAFRSFDPSGTQTGSLTKDDVQLINGLFTVTLDFGSRQSSAETGSSIEIAIRPFASTGKYIKLSPRQSRLWTKTLLKGSNYSVTGKCWSGLGNGIGRGSGIGSGSGRFVGSGTNVPYPGMSHPKPTITSPLKITLKPRALYTDAARHDEIQGTVSLKITFLVSGQVGAISVVSGLPDGLTQQAIDAAKNIKFEPKRVSGVAVSTTQIISYGFNIY